MIDLTVNRLHFKLSYQNRKNIKKINNFFSDFSKNEIKKILEEIGSNRKITDDLNIIPELRININTIKLNKQGDIDYFEQNRIRKIIKDELSSLIVKATKNNKIDAKSITDYLQNGFSNNSLLIKKNQINNVINKFSKKQLDKFIEFVQSNLSNNNVKERLVKELDIKNLFEITNLLKKKTKSKIKLEEKNLNSKKEYQILLDKINHDIRLKKSKIYNNKNINKILNKNKLRRDIYSIFYSYYTHNKLNKEQLSKLDLYSKELNINLNKNINSVLEKIFVKLLRQSIKPKTFINKMFLFSKNAQSKFKKSLQIKTLENILDVLFDQKIFKYTASKFILKLVEISHKENIKTNKKILHEYLLSKSIKVLQLNNKNIKEKFILSSLAFFNNLNKKNTLLKYYPKIDKYFKDNIKKYNIKNNFDQENNISTFNQNNIFKSIILFFKTGVLNNSSITNHTRLLEIIIDSKKNNTKEYDKFINHIAKENKSFMRFLKFIRITNLKNINFFDKKTTKEITFITDQLTQKFTNKKVLYQNLNKSIIINKINNKSDKNSINFFDKKDEFNNYINSDIVNKLLNTNLDLTFKIQNEKNNINLIYENLVYYLNFLELPWWSSYSNLKEFNIDLKNNFDKSFYKKIVNDKSNQLIANFNNYIVDLNLKELQSKILSTNIKLCNEKKDAAFNFNKIKNEPIYKHLSSDNLTVLLINLISYRDDYKIDIINSLNLTHIVNFLRRIYISQGLDLERYKSNNKKDNENFNNSISLVSLKENYKIYKKNKPSITNNLTQLNEQFEINDKYFFDLIEQFSIHRKKITSNKTNHKKSIDKDELILFTYFTSIFKNLEPEKVLLKFFHLNNFKKNIYYQKAIDLLNEDKKIHINALSKNIINLYYILNKNDLYNNQVFKILVSSMLTYFEETNSYSDEKFFLFFKYYSKEININYEKFINKISALQKIYFKNKELNTFLNTIVYNNELEFENKKTENILSFFDLDKKNNKDNQHKKIRFENLDNISKLEDLEDNSDQKISKKEIENTNISNDEARSKIETENIESINQEISKKEIENVDESINQEISKKEIENIDESSDEYVNKTEIENKNLIELDHINNIYSDDLNSSDINEITFKNLFKDTSEINNNIFDENVIKLVLNDLIYNDKIEDFIKEVENQNIDKVEKPLSFDSIISNNIEPIFINNAGIIILWPFLTNFFKNLNLLEDKQFKDKYCQQKGIYLLHYLLDSNSYPEEFSLVLNKILCGYPIEEVITNQIEINKDDKKEVIILLKSFKKSWSALKNTNINAISETFFKRDGLVKFQDNKCRIIIERKSIDILLQTLPWNTNIIRFPWINFPIFVEWITKN